MVAVIFFEENNVSGELLQRGETLAAYNNFELSSPGSPTSKKASATATQLRQNDEDYLRRDDLTEDDHGNVRDDDEFYEDAVQEKKRKAATMLKAQREILKDEEAFDETDGSSATMASCDEEGERESMFMDEDQITYDQDFTNTYFER